MRFPGDVSLPGELIGELMVFDELVFDELVFDELVFDELVFDELVFDALVFDALVFDALVFDALVFDEPWFDEPWFDALARKFSGGVLVSMTGLRGSLNLAGALRLGLLGEVSALGDVADAFDGETVGEELPGLLRSRDLSVCEVGRRGGIDIGFLSIS